MKPKLNEILVVSDMDGTLLTTDKELLACNLETIRLFTSLGGHFTVATGRMMESVAKYDEILPYLTPAITSGGCVIYDFAKKSVCTSESLPAPVVKRAIQDIADAFPTVGIIVMGADMRNYLLTPSDEMARLFSDESMTYLIRPSQELPAEWNKVLLAGPHELLLEVEEYTKTKDYPGVYFVHTSKTYFEIMPEGVSKGSALHHLCELVGVSVANVHAIGDYYNDVEIMQESGYSVAMGNAPSDIKMLAKEVTGHCNEGGVGQYLYKLIKEYGTP